MGFWDKYLESVSKRAASVYFLTKQNSFNNMAGDIHGVMGMTGHTHNFWGKIGDQRAKALNLHNSQVNLF